MTRAVPRAETDKFSPAMSHTKLSCVSRVYTLMSTAVFYRIFEQVYLSEGRKPIDVRNIE